MKLVAFDLETTGREAQFDRIVEFCFIELDEALAERGRWTSLVNPGIPIPAEVVEVHGITDEMVADAPTFASLAPRVEQLVEGSILMAHSHRFDVGFLHHELVRAGRNGIAVDHPCIDTLAIERQVNSHRLSAMYERYVGRELDGAHRSEADTQAMVEVFKQQRQVHSDALPEDIVQLIVPNLMQHFGAESADRQFMDHERRFYRDSEGIVRFNFGKHRDQRAADHPDYLRWMLNRDFSEEVRRTAALALAETA